MKTGGSARNGPQVESAPKKNLVNKKSNDKEFKCKNCDFKTTIQSTLQRHMLKHIANLHGQEKENNCMECDFQGNNQVQLKKHMNLKHTIEGTTSLETIT